MAGTKRPMVPTKIISPILLRAASEGFNLSYEDGRVAALAERVGSHFDTVWAVLHGRRAGVSFDLADRLMCALNVVHMWRDDPELAEVYERMSIWEKCQHPDCHSYWDPSTQRIQDGARRKKYCSAACKVSHNRGYHRWKSGTGTKGTHSKLCRNGHKRTPENTMLRKSGAILCRDCVKASRVQA